MPSFAIVPEDGSSKTPWRVEWDDEHFVLRDNNGKIVFETDTASAYRVIDLSQTFVDGVIGLNIGPDCVRFKGNSTLEAAFRKMIDTGLRQDPEYRAKLRRRSQLFIVLGPLMFLFAGGFFACYCWFAIGSPNPPPDSWFWYFRWLIRIVLFGLFAVGLVGLGLTFSGLNQLRRIRRIEREMRLADNDPS